MKIRLILFLFQFLIADQHFDPAAYYKVLKEGSLTEINRELSALDGLPVVRKEAYTGALLMKKAGLLQKPREKLEQFKKGRIGLETSIHADSVNAEYRFLRLIIQEHAPKITKYREQLTSDGVYIRQHYKALPAAVQEVIRDYSRTSVTLQAAGLNVEKSN